MNVSLHTAVPRIYFGGVKPDTVKKVITEGADLTAAELKELRYNVDNKDGADYLKALYHAQFCKGEKPSGKPVEVGLDSVKGRAKHVPEGPAIKPSQEQVDPEMLATPTDFRTVDPLTR